MATLTDSRFQALRDLTYTGATSDMLLQWLQANGATSNHVSDAWREVLTIEGYPSTGEYQFNDAWYEYLGDLGYTGSLNDRQLQFWESGNISFSTLVYAPLQTSIIPNVSDDATVTTYTRNSAATFVDFEGIVRTANLGEPRFAGARRVENLQPNSANITGSVATGATIDEPSSTFTTTAGLFGNIELPTSNFDLTKISNDLVVSFNVSSPNTSGLTLQILRLGGSISQHVFDVTSVSTRVYSVPLKYVGDGTGPLLVKLVGFGAGEIFTVTDIQIEDVTGQSDQTASEYVSNGVLTAPFHGAGVDGVKYFSIKNDGSKIDSNDYYSDDFGNWGYLAESAHTNVYGFSEDFSQLGSNVNATYPTTEHISFSGNVSSTLEVRSVDTGGTGQVRTNAPVKALTPGKNTVSVFAKAGTMEYFRLQTVSFGANCSAVFKLVDELGITFSSGAAFISAGTESLANGWVRCFMTFDTGASATGNFQFFMSESNATTGNTPLDGSAWFLMGGMQVEAGEFRTSYVKTIDASAATRVVDTLNYSSANNLVRDAGAVGATVTSLWENATGATNTAIFSGNAIINNDPTQDATKFFQNSPAGNVSNVGNCDFYRNPEGLLVEYAAAEVSVTVNSQTTTGTFAAYSPDLEIWVACSGPLGGNCWNGTVRNVRIRE